jgi:hypothetical protein
VATAVRDGIRASDGDSLGPAEADAAAAGSAAVTCGGVLAAGRARPARAGVAPAGHADGAAGAGRAGFTAADVGPAEAGAAAGRLSAACRGRPDDWLIRTPTEATTAADATTPASTVMEARKLISSIRAYMPSRKADSPLARERRGRRHRVR